MSYDVAKQVGAAIEAEVAARSQALKALRPVVSGPMGLTPDAVKFSPPYRAAKQALDEASARLRAFNAAFTKRFKAEIAADRAARAAAREAEGMHGDASRTAPCRCLGGSTHAADDPAIRLCDLCGGTVPTDPVTGEYDATQASGASAR